MAGVGVDGVDLEFADVEADFLVTRSPDTASRGVRERFRACDRCIARKTESDGVETEDTEIQYAYTCKCRDRDISL